MNSASHQLQLTIQSQLKCQPTEVTELKGTILFEVFAFSPVFLPGKFRRVLEGQEGQSGPE
jgi:hypothetical protein